jgi:hypothetical protein
MKYVTAAALGFVLCLGMTTLRPRGAGEAIAGQDDSPGKVFLAKFEKAEADIKRLQDTAPDQAHVMMSAAYNFSNLWFAAKAGNWPLADFYWGETRSHLRWAVRVIPIRKDEANRDVDLRVILEAVENSPLKQLQEAIKAKDSEKFVAAYKFALESCYACHKATNKPYLRPQIPERPAEPIICFDPKSDWPK